jgi:hypothetical protein
LTFLPQNNVIPQKEVIMTEKKKGGGVDIFLAIVLAAFLIWQKDSLSKII